MAPRQVAKLPIQEMPRLVHELQVYQAELEMQNDELHRIQEELEISRERFVELFDFAPIGYVMLGEDGKIREANLTAAKLLEWNRSELMNLSFERFICPESQDVFYLHRRQVFESNGKQNCRLMLRKPGGGAFAAELESIAVGERSGGIQCFLIALRDITDRELADRALRESEQSLAEFFEDAPVGLIWVDPGGRVLRINRAQLEILERSREGVLGSSVADLFVDPEVATDMLLRLAEEKPLKQCRARLRCGGGG
jgi:PAS domain S-box-containing protein